MDTLEEAKRNFEKADHRLKVAATVLVVFFVAMFIFLAVQLVAVQSSIARNQAANAQSSKDRFAAYTADNVKQHEKTQAYIRCIATTLLLTNIDQRTVEPFNKCSAPVDSKTP